MCGVGGLVSFSGCEEPQLGPILENMTKQLYHRGPDAFGVSRFKNGGFAHTRLAIIDLDPRSNQPMWSNDDNTCLSFNGEIYNFNALREQTRNRYDYKTQSDSEVILACYQLFGPKAFEMLDGIFAFSLWDEKLEKLFLVRDPIGVKPLYYSLQGNKIVFGSEIKAVLCDKSIDRSIDLEQINHFFTFGHTSCPGTGLEAIHQVEPGQFVEFSKNGLATRRYWDWNIEPVTGDAQELTEQFEELFLKTVRSQLVSDTPLTCFLSGGLDSSAIAWALSQGDNLDVEMFSYGFKDDFHDESKEAKATASHLGLPFNSVLEDENFRDLPQKLSWFLEDPMADSSSLAFFGLCQAASKKYKVALSGDGADELLAGYSTYPATSLSNRLQKIGFNLIAPTLRSFAQSIPPNPHPYSFQQKFSRFTNFGSKPFPENHAAWRTHFSKNLKNQIYSNNWLQAETTDLDHPYKVYSKASLNILPPQPTWLGRCLSMDLSHYLLNDMLVKVDRMSMAHGLEVRVPFLAPEFVRFCAGLPDSMKLGGGSDAHSGKLILREFLKDKVPTQVTNRKKSGFTVPIYKYLRDYWIDDLNDLMETNRDVVSEFIAIDQVQKMAKIHKQGKGDHRYELFDLMMFTFWLQNTKNVVK